MAQWTRAYELNEHCERVSGSPDALADAIRRGADLRICTAFNYEEHMGPAGQPQGLIEESIDLRVTYLIDDRWTAGVTTTRYPADCALKFQPYPSLSFFLYNQDGRQGIARPFLAGAGPPTCENPDSTVGQVAPKYFVHSVNDADTRSPSENFLYHFDTFRFCVCDDWTEVLSHDAQGNAVSGSDDALADAARSGHSLKVGVRDLCAPMDFPTHSVVSHEVFVELGSIYNHADRGFLGGESLPIVRVAPAAPLAYASGNWNFGWILPRSDGTVHHKIIDPCTREFSQLAAQNRVRWFAR